MCRRENNQQHIHPQGAVANQCWENTIMILKVLSFVMSLISFLMAGYQYENWLDPMNLQILSFPSGICLILAILFCLRNVNINEIKKTLLWLLLIGSVLFLFFQAGIFLAKIQRSISQVTQQIHNEWREEKSKDINQVRNLNFTELLQGYNIVAKDSKFTNQFAKQQLLECFKAKSQEVSGYFERPQFGKEIETFINSTYFGQMMGAYKIGKSVFLRQYAEQRPYVLYFNLYMYHRDIDFHPLTPCSILSQLNLQFFSTTFMDILYSRTQQIYNDTLPVIIFDQTERFQLHWVPEDFLKALINNFVVNSNKNIKFRLIFVDSEGNLLRNYFEDGVIEQRFQTYYVPGFRVNESCLLWLHKKVSKVSNQSYDGLLYHNRTLCNLLNSTLTLPSLWQIQRIDSSLDANFILDQLSFFLELYLIGGDQFGTYEKNREGTIGQVERLFRSYSWYADKSIFDDKESVQFLKELIRVTNSSSFDGLSVHGTEYAESLVARSYFVRIETDSKRRDFFYFRTPYFRELVIQVFERKNIKLE